MHLVGQINVSQVQMLAICEVAVGIAAEQRQARYLLDRGNERSSAQAIVKVGIDVLSDQVGRFVSHKIVLKRPYMRTWQV